MDQGYVRDIENLAPVMSDELRDAVTTWRTAHTAAIAALGVLANLDDDRAFAAAAAADEQAAAAAITGGDYSDPAHTAMDQYATDLQAAIRGADHRTAQCYEAHTHLVELAAGPAPFRALDPAVVKVVTASLAKIRDAASSDLDMRSAFINWVPKLTAAFGRQDVSAPVTTGGPATQALDALASLIATLAATGVDGA